jgi:hypothetical protein
MNSKAFCTYSVVYRYMLHPCIMHHASSSNPLSVEELRKNHHGTMAEEHNSKDSGSRDIFEKEPLKTGRMDESM